jgi:deoxyribonuclease V
MDKVIALSEFSVEKAHRTQMQLSKKIIFKDRLPEKIRLVAGVDVVYINDQSIATVAVLDYDSLELLESERIICRTRFPYVPTLLSFRELSPTILAIRKLRLQPDIFLVDGHGFAHPYRCGFASHLGLLIKKPTIGVAKRKLVGEIIENDESRDIAFLNHNGEIIGAAVKTKPETKPLYVSIGHMISLETAINVTQHCIRDHLIPEPLLRAHAIATSEKRKINIGSVAE